MRLHEKGAKAERDREYCLKKYDEIATFFRIKRILPNEIAMMTTSQIYRLCEDEYNRQPNRRKREFTEWLGLTPRSNPLAFKWFVSDTLKIKQPQSLTEKVIIYLQLPFRYPGFLKRKKQRMAAEKQMADAAKAKPTKEHAQP